MSSDETKRLWELAESAARNQYQRAEIYEAILAAIEPYRAALTDSRAMLSTVVNETGWTAADEHVKEIDALLGEEATR